MLGVGAAARRACQCLGADLKEAVCVERGVGGPEGGGTVMVARHFVNQVCEYFGAARMPLPVRPVTHTLSPCHPTPCHIRPVTTPTDRARERGSERKREAARH